MGKRFLPKIFMAIALLAASALAQTNERGISQLPQVEPFSISRGSSFSASAPRSAPPASSNSPAKIVEDFTEALQIIRKNHFAGSSLDHADLNKFAVTAMLRALDPHSNYFDAGEYKDLLTDQRSEYFGIGATIAAYRNGESLDTFIVSTFPDSPAHRAGLRFGDRIVAVGGENMTGKSSSFVRDKVRGRKGTLARLTVERADSRRIEVIEIKRNRVPQPSIPDAYLLTQNVGYIEMSAGFNYTTADELAASIKSLETRGMTALILDLRDNPGGILEQAVRAAENFLPRGSTIVTQRGRFAVDNRVWKSNNPNPIKIPLVVLVNENSASASEIVAGALQDHDRALIIGQKTFGKGLVQSVINLPYGSGLTLTTARYFTPSGRSIQRDYESTDLYDYYHKTSLSDENSIRRTEAKTVSGRRVFGDSGIEPDEAVALPRPNRRQNAFLDPVFFFARDLAGGRIEKLENFRSHLPVRYGQRVRPETLLVNEEVFAAFRHYVLNSQNFKISAESIESEKAFIKSRIAFHLATARYGIVSANQILAESDPQIAAAVRALPRALLLSRSAEKTR